MDFWVLHGSDDEAIRERRRVLLDAAGVQHESIDLNEDTADALVNAIGSPSLFSPRRVIALDGLELLDERTAKTIATLAASSDAYVVARASNPTAALLKPLKGFASIEKFTTPRAAALKDRVREIAARHGVKLNNTAEKVVVARAGHDLDRVSSMCRQLELAGIANPSQRQVEVLLGSSSPDGVPWSISDALERFDFKAALAAASGQEPIAVLAYLTNQITAAARVAETGAQSASAAAERLGISQFAAEKAMWWRRSLGRNIPSGVSCLARADEMAKSSAGGENALAYAIATLCLLLNNSRV
jgi:DNA polymerase III delta subunit